MNTPEIRNYNRPYATSVLIDTKHIGDDNDYSCFLSTCIFELWKAGKKEMALLLAHTDPMLNEQYTKESFEERMLSHVAFLNEQEQLQTVYANCYRD